MTDYIGRYHAERIEGINKLIRAYRAALTTGERNSRGGYPVKPESLETPKPQTIDLEYGKNDQEQSRKLKVFHIGGQIHGFIYKAGTRIEKITYMGDLEQDLTRDRGTHDRIAAYGFLARKSACMARILTKRLDSSVDKDFTTSLNEIKAHFTNPNTNELCTLLNKFNSHRNGPFDFNDELAKLGEKEIKAIEKDLFSELEGKEQALIKANFRVCSRVNRAYTGTTDNLKISLDDITARLDVLFKNNVSDNDAKNIFDTFLLVGSEGAKNYLIQQQLISKLTEGNKNESSGPLAKGADETFRKAFVMAIITAAKNCGNGAINYAEQIGELKQIENAFLGATNRNMLLYAQQDQLNAIGHTKQNLLDIISKGEQFLHSTTSDDERQRLSREIDRQKAAVNNMNRRRAELPEVFRKRIIDSPIRTDLNEVIEKNPIAKETTNEGIDARSTVMGALEAFKRECTIDNLSNFEESLTLNDSKIPESRAAFNIIKKEATKLYYTRMLNINSTYHQDCQRLLKEEGHINKLVLQNVPENSELDSLDSLDLALYLAKQEDIDNHIVEENTGRKYDDDNNDDDDDNDDYNKEINKISDNNNKSSSSSSSSSKNKNTGSNVPSKNKKKPASNDLFANEELGSSPNPDLDNDSTISSTNNGFESPSPGNSQPPGKGNYDEKASLSEANIIEVLEMELNPEVPESSMENNDPDDLGVKPNLGVYENSTENKLCDTITKKAALFNKNGVTGDPKCSVIAKEIVGKVKKAVAKKDVAEEVAERVANTSTNTSLKPGGP